MAGKRTVDIGFFKVTGQPNRIHRILLDYLPFWQGADPQFELIIEATTDIDHESKFLYSIEYSNGDSNPPQQLNILPMKKDDKRTYTLVPMPLICTGDSFLIVSEILSESRLSGDQTVYSFHTTARSWLALAIIAGIFAGIFATLANLFINC